MDRPGAMLGILRRLHLVLHGSTNYSTDSIYGVLGFLPTVA
jgi:hypothetical protein